MTQPQHITPRLGSKSGIFLGLMLLADIMSYTGGYGRKRVPGYTGY